MYIYADSNNRDVTQYPHGNTYTLYLTTPINKVSSVKLVSARVPNTLYNITNGSNVLTFNGTNYSIFPGYYSTYGFATALYNTTGGALNVNYLDDSGLFLFFASASFTLSFNTTEAQLIAGLPAGTFSSSAASSNVILQNNPTYSSSQFVLAQNIADTNINEFLFLDIEEFRQPNIFDSRQLNYASRQSYVGTSIERVTGVVPMDVNSGQIKVFKDASDFSLTIPLPQPVLNLQRLTIRWLDRNHTIVNFNGYENNSFLLEIGTA